MKIGSELNSGNSVKVDQFNVNLTIYGLISILCNIDLSSLCMLHMSFSLALNSLAAMPISQYKYISPVMCIQVI